MARKPVLYLANPYGFSEFGRENLQKIVANIVDIGFEVVEPFAHSQDLGNRIVEIGCSETISDKTKSSRLHAINTEIGKRNRVEIDKCELVFAILDGDDTGVAAEIGYACAVGKRIIGYRGDFRISGDNAGSCVNLQVEYFIEASGGSIVRTFLEAVNILERTRSEISE